MSVLDQLRESLSDFSRNERHVADYILNNPQEMRSLSGEALAAICGVSRSTVLRLCQNVTAGLHVNEAIVNRTLREYLPFLATEDLMMEAVKRGGDRQQLHEIIREASMQETAKMKNGESWDLVAQLAARPEFGMTAEEIRAELEPSRYIGRCPEQVAAMTAACRTLIGADAQQAEELTL